VKKTEHFTEPIREELARFEAFFEQSLNADTEPMGSIMRYVQESRGKRLRPILVLFSAKLLGKVNELTMRAATFVEMVHSATLIHDDVVDDADQRRNKASVKAQFGNLSAVLAGDYLLAKAMLLIANDTDILNEMLRTTAAMSEGELMQNIIADCVSQSEKTTQYLDIITRKTAMLMRSCCVAGALSVNATSEQIQQIADFGLNFGILFQLRDDLLDGENMEQAQTLLPEYLQKALDSLKLFPESETLEALRDLTAFCAERED
jgi:octaprenyl-diphosphate synthase